ncbi:exodeoxyribonuclease VII large subunit [Thioalkalivibrio sp. HK1]|uniref:exodeoxyribonuclease VII large subunit n=1 Tax=Thioalkalivibrio sp. HK1 TaxID=1469245 RepID=UPI00047079C4|nr:exodeoxyribonuclease VII large subunit [Thioalkalivibrio sp. HK1]
MPAFEFNEPHQGDPDEIYTITRLNREARSLLEDTFGMVRVEGEISGLTRSTAGHLYFSLKDERCHVRCVMFAGSQRFGNLKFEPADGMSVLAKAAVSLYDVNGSFQLRIQRMEEAGAGAALRSLEKLKAALQAEGLFDARHKRPLPDLPRRIGLVTSPTGAVVQDMLRVLKRRFPAIPILIHPIPVQGEGAADEIARMLDRACRRGECDLLILARGGGSAEDLKAFNEEVLARAIFRATIPIITGIGHEPDFTIADCVADASAPTPSVAAEKAAPDKAEWLKRFRGLESLLQRAIRRTVDGLGKDVDNLLRRLSDPRRRLEDHAQRLDHVSSRLDRRMHRLLQAKRERTAMMSMRLNRQSLERIVHRYRHLLERLERGMNRALTSALDDRRMRVQELDRTLRALGPDTILERGYSILLKGDGETKVQAVRDASEVRPGERLHARLARGSLELEVVRSQEGSESSSGDQDHPR